MSEDGDAAAGAGTDEGPDAGDTFGVGIHVTSEVFQFVVHVPSDIDSGWSDPDEFQRLIERVTWETLDQEDTLRAVARTAGTDETVTLGTVTMRPDGELLAHTLSSPAE
ncbi:hypothetical protein [Halobaculum marinum]|uniref:DUF8124 domain-containing protein n=1 Tax=Halobaculum marinum TaxID=3031996 RepID=A0ABD5WUJ6_9EURY|nr:hypothetical protein [Halobaculum sp. DT55]